VDVKGELAGRILRGIALVALVLGLSDAARLLGISGGAQSPIALYGATGFAYLTVFCLARLFAAVGIWIRASWGAVLLVGATVLEIVLYLFGIGDVEMSLLGFVVRVLMVLGIVVLFALSLRLRRARE
jgi:hypothetical protein